MKAILATAAALLALAAPAQADVCQQIELHKQVDALSIQIERDLALSSDNTKLILSNSAWDRKAIESGCVPSPNLYF
jgi:opacity protein-like surface antigen